MEITYIVIISVIAYICGAITKAFFDEIPNKYIPMQNVLIGIMSGLVCFIMQVEPNIFESIIFCIIATMGAGGIADLINLKNKM